MTIEDGKYIVHKYEDWNTMLKRMGAPQIAIPHPLARLEAVQDAVVIRRQDVFAPPALDAYSNAIMTAVEIMKKDPAGYNDHVVNRLTEIADYFHEQALMSWDTVRKVPD